MIVTRQRKKKRHLARLLLPLAAIAAFAFAITWGPSRDILANGPTKPLWTAGANASAVLARPLTFAQQQNVITDRNREIRTLTAQLERQRADKAAADAHAQQLAQQLATLQNQPKPTAVPAPARTAAPAANGLSATVAAPGAPSADAVTPPTEDEKRVAATWAAMEPEKAAAVIQRLPDDRVSRVLAAMDPDSAAGILNALPAAVAARLSRNATQVSSSAGR